MEGEKVRQILQAISNILVTYIMYTGTVNETSGRQLFLPIPYTFLRFFFQVFPRVHIGVCGLEGLCQEFKNHTFAALQKGRTSRSCNDDNCASKPSLFVVGSPDFLFFVLSPESSQMCLHLS